MGAEPILESRFHIRWLIRRDLDEVLQIEQESFEFPWQLEDFLHCLRQRNCIGMVCEHQEVVVGFMIYELQRARLHLLNLAVRPSHRRRGIGRRLMANLANKLSGQRRTRIMLEVRETNVAAQLFFRECGFRAVSVLREFYEDSPEDAYLFQYRLRGGSSATLPMPRPDGGIQRRLAG